MRLIFLISFFLFQGRLLSQPGEYFINDTLEYTFKEKIIDGNLVYLKGIRHRINHKKYIPTKYSRLYAYNLNQIIFGDEKVCGIINIKGDTLVPPIYANIIRDNFYLFYNYKPNSSNSNVIATKTNSKYYYFNPSSDFKNSFNIYPIGEKFKYENLIYVLDTNLKPITNDHFVYSSFHGKIKTVLRPDYDSAQRIYCSYHFIDENGYIDVGDSIEWADFNVNMRFDQTIRRFKVKSGMAVLNDWGEVIVKPVFDTIIIKGNVIEARRNDSLYYFNDKGTLVFNSAGERELHLFEFGNSLYTKAPLIVKEKNFNYFINTRHEKISSDYNHIRPLFSSLGNVKISDSVLTTNQIPEILRTSVYFECLTGTKKTLLNDKLDTILSGYDYFIREILFEKHGLAIYYTKSGINKLFFPDGNTIWGDSIINFAFQYDINWTIDKLFLESKSGKIYECDISNQYKNLLLPYFPSIIVGTPKLSKEYRKIISITEQTQYMLNKNNRIIALDPHHKKNNWSYGLDSKKLKKLTEFDHDTLHYKFFQFADNTYQLISIVKFVTNSSEQEIYGDYKKNDSIQFTWINSELFIKYYKGRKVFLGDMYQNKIPEKYYYDSIIIPSHGYYFGYLGLKNNRWKLYNRDQWKIQNYYGTISKKELKILANDESFAFECDSFKIINPDSCIIQYYDHGNVETYLNGANDRANDPNDYYGITIKNPDSLLLEKFEELKSKQKNEIIFWYKKASINSEYYSFVFKMDSTGAMSGYSLKGNPHKKGYYFNNEIKQSYIHKYDELRNYKAMTCPEYFPINNHCPYKFCYTDDIQIKIIEPDGREINQSLSTSVYNICNAANFNDGLPESLRNYSYYFKFLEDILLYRISYR